MSSPRRIAPFALVLVALLLPACVVERQAVRPPRCAGGVLVEGHYDRFGRWHHAHWRCPGPRGEVVIVAP